MINAGIFPGDLALVREQCEVENGYLAAVIVDNEEGTLKKFYKNAGNIILQSANPNYEPRIFSGKETERVRVIGVVREIKRKF